MRKAIGGVGFLAALGLLVVTMVACGGSNSSLTGNNWGCGGPFNVAGDWTITANFGGGSASGLGVITKSGLPVFFQTSPPLAGGSDGTAFLPTISGACSFSGTATVYAPGNAVGWQAQSQSVQGTVKSSSSITGTVAGGGNFSLAASTPLSGSVAALSGNMFAQGVSFFGQVSLQPTGQNQDMTISTTQFAGNSCSLNGILNQEPNLNVFDVSITFGGAGCPHDINGIGFESNSDYFNVSGGAQGTFLYVADSGSSTVLEIFP